MTALAFVLSSCSKADFYRGSYTFKTGGYVIVSDIETTVRRDVVMETGQMHIVQESGDNLKLTMNITGGDPVVYDAVLKDGKLELKPVIRKVYFHAGEDYELVDRISAMCECSASGQRTENVLILDFVYEGVYEEGDFKGEIIESHVSCVAVANE